MWAAARYNHCSIIGQEAEKSNVKEKAAVGAIYF